MTSIQKIVNDLIQQQPFIEEALSQGIINHNEYGRKLKPEVELNLKREVNDAAVSMAVRRYARQLTPQVLLRNQIDLTGTDIMVRNGLFEITVQKSPETLKIIQKIQEVLKISARDFLTLTYGMYEVTIVTNNRFMDALELLFTNKTTSKIVNLSALSIRLPEDSSDSIGLYYVITKVLAWIS